MDRSHPVRFEHAARLRQSRGRTTVLVLSRPSRVEHAARLRQSRGRPTVLVLSRPSRVERAAHHHSSCRRCQCFYRLLSEAISESRLASKFCMLLNVVNLGGGRMGCRGGRACAKGCYGDFTKHGLFAARGTKFCATFVRGAQNCVHREFLSASASPLPRPRSHSTALHACALLASRTPRALLASHTRACVAAHACDQRRSSASAHASARVARSLAGSSAGLGRRAR